jgi:glucose-6-phosphate isomerase
MPGYSASLGAFQGAVDAALEGLKRERVLDRIWAHDYSVWKQDPTETSNRLGWLHSPEQLLEDLRRISALVDTVRADGYTHALLLGMGGSSLAPETFRRTYGVKPGYLDLAVLDSTDPGAVLTWSERLDPARTLFIVSTKSGGTVETFSFFKYFYTLMANAVGEEQAGAYFIAITDPGSKLAETAAQYRFRAVFLNDPNIGGRYSALSHFGIVPAALVGVDLETLLHRAQAMAHNSEGCNCPVAGDNGGARLGAAMGVLARAGRDKVTLVASPSIAGFGAWVEQLIAESTGKEGRGILSVADEPLKSLTVYGNDRLFCYLRLEGDTTHDAAVAALEMAGHPVVRIALRDHHDLGGEFFRWEIATALAGRFLGINPFDQPNVESAKVLARKMVAAYQRDGRLPMLTPTLQGDGISVYADVTVDSVAGALRAFLARSKAGDYISLYAYVQPRDETTRALDALRAALRDRMHLATTVGYGPRFLHSTGQLHKGDGGNGSSSSSRRMIRATCRFRTRQARRPPRSASGCSRLPRPWVTGRRCWTTTGG